MVVMVFSWGDELGEKFSALWASRYGKVKFVWKSSVS